MQLTLIQDTNIKKSIITVPTQELKLSRYNPRYSRDEDAITRLAQRISRNGFEITRAMWAVRNGSGYEVFAGGTRLEAAKRAGCKSVPIVLHEGLTEDDVVRLADEDNENDEYHEKVSPVDVWANYAWLSEQGWTQKRIAEAKGENPGRVSERIKWNKLPDSIKKFFQQETLNEGHLREVTSSFNVESFLFPWLSLEQVYLELIQEVAKRKMTVRQTQELVSKLKAVIVFAQDCYTKLDEDWQPKFIILLAEASARTKAQVQTAYNEIVTRQLEEAKLKEDELARLQSEAGAERVRLQREQEKAARVEAILSNIHHGDFIEVCQRLEPGSVDVIITDPPYSEEFLPLYEQLAKVAQRLLRPGGSLLAMCGQSYLPEVFRLMTPHLTYHWTLSYLTPGGQAPQIWPRKINTFWKPILWFMNGDYQGDWQGDVIKSDVNDNDKRFHHWGQSESGIAHLVERYSDPSDLILDPFLGGGTIGVVALKLGRRFIGIDNDQTSIKTSKERIFELLQEQDHE